MGELVYSLEAGARVVVPVGSVLSRPAPPSGYVRVELDDGTSFVTSAVHPLADGRLVEALAGDPHVRSVAPAAAPAARTWDILPASRSGVYFVGTIPFASTLGLPPDDAHGRCGAERFPEDWAGPGRARCDPFDDTGNLAGDGDPLQQRASWDPR